MGYRLLKDKQMNYGNLLDQPTTGNPEKDLAVSAILDGNMDVSSLPPPTPEEAANVKKLTGLDLLNMGKPNDSPEIVDAAGNPIDMNESVGRAPAANKKAAAVKQMAIPESGGATMGADGMITLAPVAANSSPKVNDISDIIKMSSAAPKATSPFMPKERMRDNVKQNVTTTTEKDDTSNTNTNKQGREEKIFDPTGTAERMQSAYDTPAIQRMVAGLDQQEKIINDEINNPGSRAVDLRGLAAFVDNQYGTHYGAYLDKPTSELERKKMLMSALDKVQDNRKDLSKAILDVSKASEVGKNTFGNQIVDIIKAARGGSVVNTNRDESKDTDIGREFMDAQAKMKAQSGRNPQVNNPKEKIWTEYAKQNKDTIEATMGASEKIKSALGQRSVTGDNLAITQFLRMAGDTRISNEDKKGFASPDLANRAEIILQKVDRGQSLTQQDRDDMLRSVGAFQKIAQKRLREQAHSHAAAAAYYQGVDPVEAEKGIIQRVGSALNSSHAGGSTSPKKAAKKSDSELMKMSPAEFDAYEKSILGGH